MPEPPLLPGTDELLDQIPCGVVLTTHTGTILRVNRTFGEWVGRLPADLLGTRLSELFTMGGRIFHQTHWMPMLQMQGSLSEVKLDVCHRSGRVIPMMLNSIRRRDAEGAGHDEIVFTVANERNKYERELLLARKTADALVAKEREAQATLQVAQARLRQALNGGSLFIWGVDASTRTRVYGPDVHRLLRCDASRAVTAEDFLGGMSGEERLAEQAALHRALQDASVPYNWTYRLTGDAPRVIAASGQSFFNPDGSLAQFVGILQDITSAEALRATAEDRALLAEQMVGIVSHDLRNPLSAILIGIEMLAGGVQVPADKRATLMQSIARSARRAQRLTAELLDFTAARVGAGITVARQEIELHAFVSQVLDELRLAFPGRRIGHVRLGNGPCTAAPDRLAQLVSNLVGNAVSYGAPDSVVTVTSRLEGDAAEIGVHNFGHVIPADVIDRVFEPMVRGSNVDSSVRSVGLGLFIVRAIAQAHHGEVTVTSNETDGTTFRFVFPAFEA